MIDHKTYEKLKRRILSYGFSYFTETEKICFYCGEETKLTKRYVEINHRENCFYVQLCKED